MDQNSICFYNIFTCGPPIYMHFFYYYLIIHIFYLALCISYNLKKIFYRHFQQTVKFSPAQLFYIIIFFNFFCNTFFKITSNLKHYSLPLFFASSFSCFALPFNLIGVNPPNPFTILFCNQFSVKFFPMLAVDYYLVLQILYLFP